MEVWLMKNKILFYAFRITVILAFITGVVYAVKFINLITQIGMLYTEYAFDDLSSWSMFFIIYEILCLAALVLSAVTFKFTRPEISTARTLVLLFATLSDLFAHKYVTVFSGYTNAVDAIDKFQDIEDEGFITILISILGVAMVLILAISSVVALKQRRIPSASAEK